MPLVPWLQSRVFHSWRQLCQLRVDAITKRLASEAGTKLLNYPFLLLSCCGWIPTGLLSIARSLEVLSLQHSFPIFNEIILVCQTLSVRDFPQCWRMLFCVLTYCTNITVLSIDGSFNVHFFSPAIQHVIANKICPNISRNGFEVFQFEDTFRLSSTVCSLYTT